MKKRIKITGVIVLSVLTLFLIFELVLFGLNMRARMFASPLNSKGIDTLDHFCWGWGHCSQNGLNHIDYMHRYLNCKENHDYPEYWAGPYWDIEFVEGKFTLVCSLCKKSVKECGVLTENAWFTLEDVEKYANVIGLDHWLEYTFGVFYEQALVGLFWSFLFVAILLPVILAKNKAKGVSNVLLVLAILGLAQTIIAKTTEIPADYPKVICPQCYMEIVNNIDSYMTKKFEGYSDPHLKVFELGWEVAESMNYDIYLEECPRCKTPIEKALSREAVLWAAIPDAHDDLKKEAYRRVPNADEIVGEIFDSSFDEKTGKWSIQRFEPNEMDIIQKNRRNYCIYSILDCYDLITRVQGLHSAFVLLISSVMLIASFTIRNGKETKKNEQ